MTPTTDEELKLRMFNGELSQLGPAERFLKVLVDIPFAFKRLEALLFMSTLTEEVAIAKESFATLEVVNLITKFCLLNCFTFILCFKSFSQLLFCKFLILSARNCEVRKYGNTNNYS